MRVALLAPGRLAPVRLIPIDLHDLGYGVLAFVDQENLLALHARVVRPWDLHLVPRGSRGSQAASCGPVAVVIRTRKATSAASRARM